MKRRATRGSARGRRVPGRTGGGGGRRLPTTALFALIGAVLIGGLIAYLIWQQSQPGSDRFAQAAALEADPEPELPGEYVDLPAVYGDAYPDNAVHVRREVDYTDQGLPPAGGPHWGSTACPTDPDEAPPFCGPAPWGIYRKPWEAATLVHNLEHGGIVVWYNTNDQGIIDELEQIVKDRLERDELLVLTPYPEMEDDYIALTAWARRDKFPVSEYSKERVEEFLDALKCRFNPEGVSGRGC